MDTSLCRVHLAPCETSFSQRVHRRRPWEPRGLVSRAARQRACQGSTEAVALLVWPPRLASFDSIRQHPRSASVESKRWAPTTSCSFSRLADLGLARLCTHDAQAPGSTPGLSSHPNQRSPSLDTGSRKEGFDVARGLPSEADGRRPRAAKSNTCCCIARWRLAGGLTRGKPGARYAAAVCRPQAGPVSRKAPVRQKDPTARQITGSVRDATLCRGREAEKPVRQRTVRTLAG